MPPKKDARKVAEDKTFGMKNKNKSSKIQKYMQQVEQQAANQQNSKKNSAKQQQGPSKKEMEQKKREEFAELFKPVQIQQKVPFGVDPKTILCQFFKAGTCTKGKNCKFSHDAAVERKSGKIDLYMDKRFDNGQAADADKEKENDLMEDWDQSKLEQVVSTKHGKGVQPTTDIVCKYFIQAVEDKKYGWFWNCPNGDTCKYRHALPSGFVLKEQKKKSEEPAQTLEEWIEDQRKHLPSTLTPITLESFNKWKKDRVARELREADEQNKQREAAVKAGRSIGASGRELFTYNPELFNTGEDDEAWEGEYTQQDEIAEEKLEEVDESLFLEENFDDLDIGEEEEEAEE